MSAGGDPMIDRLPLSAGLDDAPTPHVAARGAPLDPDVPGYTCGERIGQGGAGAVFAAIGVEDQAPAAIKVGYSAAPVLVERFRREAFALERVGPPHVARLLARGVLG